MSGAPRIAIIGGGPSGALVAHHLLAAQIRSALTVIDPAAAIGPGLAFGRCEPFHLLNVPAGRMSALPDLPNHFMEWLRLHARTEPTNTLMPSELSADSFVSRLLYGDYLRTLVKESTASGRSSFTHERDTAEAVQYESSEYRIALGSGRPLVADIVVLALGNFAPTSNLPQLRNLSDHPRYSHSIWSDLPWRKAAPTDTVLCIGTGLTMVDAVLAFARSGHTGPIIGISRHGLLPACHQLGGTSPAVFASNALPRDLATALSAVRSAVVTARTAGIPWQAVLDSLRSITPDLWAGFPPAEQRRFLRHLKSFWETNRHRLAPELHREIESLRSTGRLTIHSGHIVGVTTEGKRFGVSVRRRGAATDERFVVDRIVNCTGPAGTLEKSASPLLRSLFEHRLVSLDPLSIGLRAGPNGGVLNATGVASTSLFTLGGLLRGIYWESTAIPEIRTQAATVARSIIERLREASAA